MTNLEREDREFREHVRMLTYTPDPDREMTLEAAEERLRAARLADHHAEWALQKFQDWEREHRSASASDKEQKLMDKILRTGARVRACLEDVKSLR